MKNKISYLHIKKKKKSKTGVITGEFLFMNNFLILLGQDLMNFANFTLNRAKVGMQKIDVLQFVK